MKRHLNCFRNSKNNFLLHFDAFLTLIFSLEKWPFWGVLAFFRPKSPKSEKVQFSSAWKRCNFSFFSLENFFFKKFRRFRIFLHTFWVSKSKNSKIQRGCRGVEILSLARFVATDSICTQTAHLKISHNSKFSKFAQKRHIFGCYSRCVLRVPIPFWGHFWYSFRKSINWKKILAKKKISWFWPFSALF